MKEIKEIAVAQSIVTVQTKLFKVVIKVFSAMDLVFVIH